MADDPSLIEARAIAKEDQMWRWMEDHAEALKRVVDGEPEHVEDRHVAKVAAGLVHLELLHRNMRRLRDIAAPSTKEDS